MPEQRQKAPDTMDTTPTPDADVNAIAFDTTRLHLREFQPADADALAAYWVLPIHQRFYPEAIDPAADARSLVARLITAQTAKPRHVYQLAITLHGSPDAIGTAGVRITRADLCEADIGYEVHPDHWGRGYASEAARAMLNFAFRDLQMHRVWAECNAANTGSSNVLRKLGMRREAHFEQSTYARGQWWDEERYAILDHEWQALQVQQAE